MIHRYFPTTRLWRRFGLLALCVCLQLDAQFFPGGGGGGGFGGGGGGRGGGGFGGGGGGRGGGGGARGGTAGSRTYPSNGTVGEAIFTSDPETRRLIVITDDETSQYISQVITNLDQPKPQVLIKVVFLEVTYNNNQDIGIEGGTTRKLNDSTSLLTSNIFGLGQQGIVPTPPGAGLYQIAGSDYQVTLRAIAQAGKTEVLSRPSILARNNQQATITVGKTLPFITNTRITDQGQTINTVQYQDIGIILRVIPFITSDGMVEMIVSPEISSLTSETIPISPGVGAPVIAKRAADTVVVTPDGQTVIIGGLMQNEKTSTDSKIPFLGDIPGLGLLFKRKVKADAKTELMIFLTPHIINQPSRLAALSAQERRASQLAPKAFTDQELDRFLDGLPVKESKPPEVKKKSGKK